MRTRALLILDPIGQSLLGFFEDYNKIVVNARHELILTRKPLQPEVADLDQIFSICSAGQDLNFGAFKISRKQF